MLRNTSTNYQRECSIIVLTPQRIRPFPWATAKRHPVTEQAGTPNLSLIDDNV